MWQRCVSDRPSRHRLQGFASTCLATCLLLNVLSQRFQQDRGKPYTFLSPTLSMPSKVTSRSHGHRAAAPLRLDSTVNHESLFSSAGLRSAGIGAVAGAVASLVLSLGRASSRRQCQRRASTAHGDSGNGMFVPGVKDYFTFTPAPNALIVDIFMREKGIGTDAIAAYERFIDLPSLENRNDECLKMNPQGSLPWFVMGDGTVVAETIAMCEYIEDVLPKPHLIGRTPQERGVVRQWQRRMEEHYCYPAFYGHRNWTSSSDCPDDHFMKNFFADRLNEHHGAHMLPEAWQDLCRWARNRIVWLERVKQDQPTAFIAGDEFSVVDVQVYVTLWFFSEAFPHPPQRILQDLEGQLPWVQDWFDRVHARPSVVAAREYRELNMALKPTAQS